MSLRPYSIEHLQNYSLEQTAEILGCLPRFLEDNLKRLPHQKIGAAKPVFAAEDILEIKAMHRVQPALVAGAPAPTAGSLAQIRPKGRRRVS
ncbi:hypothetical protein [Streptomyces erythrochromogenes]|uniref:hypothetical protein n=1 Tax=Streptomyces erythrochromogenes TaxID=285574 RepID=UPI0034493F0A